MTNILEIIEAFSKEDQKDFRKFLAQKNRRGDTKNLRLFDYLCKGITKNLDQKLYGRPARNNFYALSKRLHDSLIDYVAIDGFSKETSDEMEVLKLLLASRIFFEKRMVKTANNTLKKAYKRAQNLDAYAILNEIFQTKIRYAHLNKEEPFQTILDAAKENHQLYEQEMELNMLSAKIEQLLRHPYQEQSVSQLIDTIRASGVIIDTRLTFKSLHQLMSIANKGAHIQQDYEPIQNFMSTVFKVVREKEDPFEKHQYYRALSYYLMALSQFRNKQFGLSTKTLQQRSKLFPSIENSKELFGHGARVLKAMNATYLGESLAASALLEQIKTPSMEIQMSLVMNYFLQSNWTKAAELVRTWQHTDNWYEKKIGWNAVIQKNILEILLYIERDKLDLALSRINSFKKRYKPQLMARNQTRALTFIDLISYVYEHPQKAKSEDFKLRVNTSFTWLAREKEDLFAMSFYAWLKAKMNRTELYPTLLELVKI